MQPEFTSLLSTVTPPVAVEEEALEVLPGAAGPERILEILDEVSAMLREEDETGFMLEDHPIRRHPRW